MLCIVRLHQGKAVRKHGRPSQTPFRGRSCDFGLERPFVGVSINITDRVQGCRTRFMALEVEPINFRFFFLLPRVGGAALSVSARTWPTRTEGRMRGAWMHVE